MFNRIYQDFDEIKELSRLIQEKFSSEIESSRTFRPQLNEVKVIFLNLDYDVSDENVDEENIGLLNFFKQFDDVRITKERSKYLGASHSVITFNQRLLKKIIDCLNTLPTVEPPAYTVQLKI